MTTPATTSSTTIADVQPRPHHERRPTHASISVREFLDMAESGPYLASTAPVVEGAPGSSRAGSSSESEDVEEGGGVPAARPKHERVHSRRKSQIDVVELRPVRAKEAHKWFFKDASTGKHVLWGTTMRDWGYIVASLLLLYVILALLFAFMLWVTTVVHRDQDRY